MLDVLLDTIIDSLKLLPFLFIAYLLMEYIEHKISDKSKERIKKSGKFGPAIRKCTWNISTVWIFCCSNKLLCSKNNYTWNANFCVFINIRRNAPNTYIKSCTHKFNIINIDYKIFTWNDLWLFNRLCNESEERKTG